MVIFCEDGGVAGGPAGLIGTLHLFFALVAMTAVLLGRIEDTVGTIVVQSTESVDIFRHTIDPPVDKVKVVAGLVDGKTSGVLTHTVPAMEIAGAVFDVDIPVQIDMGDTADLAVNDHFTDLGVDGVIAVVEGADEFTFGFLLSFHHLESVSGVGGHGLFADDINIVTQSADDVFNMETVHADDQNGIGFGLSHHLVKVCSHVFGHILGFGNSVFADLETQRIDVEHTDQLSTMLELTEHGADVHVDRA